MSGNVIYLRPELAVRDVRPVTEEVAEQQRIIRELAAQLRNARKARNAARS